MKRFFFVAALFAVVVGTSHVALSPGASAASGVSVEPFVWQFDEDYPPGGPGDSAAPVDTIYLKTHEGTTWMSTWDASPMAISGPDAVKAAVDRNRAQGVRTIAWFVPIGSDYAGQIDMAKTILDLGVDALYADIEPYEGFCNWDCSALAEHFWKPLRAERPDATLGVIYDPRPHHWEQSAIFSWTSVSDVALPMCYWDTFVDQPPWNDPRECVRHAIMGLYHVIAPGSDIEFVPIFQGDTTPDRMQAGLNALTEIGLTRVSVWRRGVVAPEIWNTLAAVRSSDSPANVLRAADKRHRLIEGYLELQAMDLLSREQSAQLMKLIERATEMDSGF